MTDVKVLEMNHSVDNGLILSGAFHDKCKSVKQCKSLKRIKIALHFYQFINGNNKNERDIKRVLLEYIKTNKYTNLINDYHHILIQHLNNKEKHLNEANYLFINSLICKVIDCKISECKLYLRNGRDREQEQRKLEEEKEDNVYMELLDNMHTYFVHMDMTRDIVVN